MDLNLNTIIEAVQRIGYVEALLIFILYRYINHLEGDHKRGLKRH